MLKTCVSRPFFEQICSKPAFPASHALEVLETPCFTAFSGLEALLSAEPCAWMLKMRVSRPFLQQIRSQPAFPGLPCSLEKLQAPFEICSDAALPGRSPRPCCRPGHRAQTAITGGTFGLMAMKHRQQAQVKPGNHAQAAGTGGTFGLMAMKRRQQAQVWPHGHEAQAASTGQTGGLIGNEACASSATRTLPCSDRTDAQGARQSIAQPAGGREERGQPAKVEPSTNLEPCTETAHQVFRRRRDRQHNSNPGA